MFKSDIISKIPGLEYCMEITGATIFGGFVRDTLRQETPNDLDLHFGSEDLLRDFVFEMSKYGQLTLSKVGTEKYHGYAYDDIHQWRIETFKSNRRQAESLLCEVGGVKLGTERKHVGYIQHIDLVCGYPWAIPDFDVNMLMVTPTGDLRVALEQVDLVQALWNISEKKCKPVHGNIRKCRIDKMEILGWEIVDHFEQR